MKCTVAEYIKPEPPGCFLGDGLVLMGDLSYKQVKEIRRGDIVLSELHRRRQVVDVRRRWVGKDYNLVFLNGLGLTTGHPVWVGHKWVRPVDIAAATLTTVGWMYDFVLDGGQHVSDHSVIINGLVVCTLGKNCGEQLCTQYPEADSRYGNGFWLRNSAL